MQKVFFFLLGDFYFFILYMPISFSNEGINWVWVISICFCFSKSFFCCLTGVQLIIRTSRDICKLSNRNSKYDMVCDFHFVLLVIFFLHNDYSIFRDTSNLFYGRVNKICFVISILYCLLLFS